MNEDPKFWEDTVLPTIHKLKAFHEEAKAYLVELEDFSFQKAGYVKMQGRYFKKEDKVQIKRWSQINFWKERRKFYDSKGI